MTFGLANVRVSFCLLGLCLGLLDAPSVQAVQSNPLNVQEARLWLNKMSLAHAGREITGAISYSSRAFERDIIFHQTFLDGHLFFHLKDQHSPSRLIADTQHLSYAREHLPKAIEHYQVSLSEFHERKGLSSLNRFYTPSLEHEPKLLAGRRVVLIDLKATDQFRYHQKFWLDEQTAVVLKKLTLSDTGEILEQFEFRQFLTEALPLAKNIQNKGVMGGESVSDWVGDAKKKAMQLKFAWLPPGFEKIHQATKALTNNRQLESVMFADGFASFSVFFEYFSQMPQKSIESKQFEVLPSVREGAVLFARRRALDRNLESSQQFHSREKEMQLTLVGDVPEKVATLVLNALSIEAL